MAEQDVPLSEDEVRQISRLIESPPISRPRCVRAIVPAVDTSRMLRIEPLKAAHALVL